MIEQILNYISIIPLWLWQIIGAMFLTITSIQIIKIFQPYNWSAYKRRKTNLALSILIGGGYIIWLYDSLYKDFVIVAFMLGNNFIYSGLAKLVEHKSSTSNGIWTVLHSFFRPHSRKSK